MSRISPNNADMELELALELSRKSFLEEENQRISADAAPDLIDIEDPRAVERRNTINRIKDLCNIAPSASFHGSASIASPWPPPPPLAMHQSTSVMAFNNMLNSSTSFGSSVPSASFSSIDIPSISQNVESRSFSLDLSTTNSQFTTTTASNTTSQFSTTASTDLIQLSPKPKTFNDLSDFDPLAAVVSAVSTPQETSSTSFQTETSLQTQTTETKEKPNDLNATDCNSNDVECSNIHLLSSDVKLLPIPLCDFLIEQRLLSEFREMLVRETKNDEVFFIAPTTQYLPRAETVKITVHQDGSWPKDTPDYPRKMTFTCSVTEKCSEILTAVLLEFASNEIEQNEGQIPLDSYALKVFGSDEFLDANTLLGYHVCVGECLSHDRDLLLEVGQKRIPLPRRADSSVRESALSRLVLTSDRFRLFLDEFVKRLNQCIQKPNDIPTRRALISAVEMQKTWMNNPAEMISVVRRLENAHNSEDATMIIIEDLVKAVIRSIYMYCRSTTTNFSIETSGYERSSPGRVVRSVGDVAGDFVLFIESLNNMPREWGQCTKFQVEIELLHGTRGFYMATSPQRSPDSAATNFVGFEYWCEFDTPMLRLPREAHLSVVIYGEDAVERRPLASGIVPLFDHKGYFLQGPLVIGLKTVDVGMIPWGPRTLVHSPDDPVLTLRFVEYDYDIVFPTEVPTTTYKFQNFDSLNEEDKKFAQWLLQIGFMQILDMDIDDKQFIWTKRSFLHDDPKALSLVLVSAFSWDCVSVSQIYPLLDSWAELSPVQATELLLPCFPDSKIRQKAVDWISRASPAFLFNFLPQFLEALRYEPYENSALSQFLLRQSRKDRSFAFELYWQLHQRIDDGRDMNYSLRCEALQSALLSLGIELFDAEVQIQHRFLREIDDLCTQMKDSPESSMDRVLQSGLRRISANMELTNHPELRLPIFPAFLCRGLKYDECGYFNSFTKPIRLCFLGEKRNYSVIYKAGDDLRQDAVVMQLVGVMDEIWRSENLDMRLIQFRCLPTGQKKGLIELVPNCKTLREIHVTAGATGVYKNDIVNKWVKANNPTEFEYSKATENFRKSCAAWSVVTYVLGISDRHNDNILLTTSGHVFHIDFGKYMGDIQMAGPFKRDRVPFVLTPDMVMVINEGAEATSLTYQTFIDEACAAFAALRKHAAALLNTIRFMCSSDIPGMDMEAQSFVQNNLMLQMSDVDALIVFSRMINTSSGSWAPRANFFAHALAQLKLSPSAMLFGGDTDYDHMNFNSGDYSQQSDGRIDTVAIDRFEKWHHPDGRKVYMYRCSVKRDNMAPDPAIFRSYADFEELHFKLRAKFSRHCIPPLGRSHYVGRANVREVAVKKQVEIQQFLLAFFRLADEISHCNLIYNFFHHSHRGGEDERRRSVRDPNAQRELHPALLDIRMTAETDEKRLRIFVGHARDVPLVGADDAETYVKTYLYRSGESFGKRKTSATKSKNPTYNQELIYNLNDDDLRNLDSMTLNAAIWQVGSSVLKDNFRLCGRTIELKCLRERKKQPPNMLVYEERFKLHYG